MALALALLGLGVVTPPSLLVLLYANMLMSASRAAFGANFPHRRLRSIADAMIYF